MTFLLAANLILWMALAAAAAAFGLHSYRKHGRSRRRSRRPGDPSKDYAPRQDWSRSTGKLNYSSFVYFDVDRDGRYSLGDRPMGGIVARLSGAKGHILTARTNGNGFANFTTSVARRRAHIGEAGTYQFAISVPPGWVCTSRNDVQTAEFRYVPGAPSGIGTDDMVKPVGLAPIRTLTGRAADMSATLSLLAREAPVLSEAVAQDAAFHIAIPDGCDTAIIEQAGLVRRLALSPYPVHVGLLSPDRAPLEPDTVLKTIDFEGVTPRGLRKVPSGFAGLNWFNLNAISRDFQGGNEGYVNGATSGDHTCYTSSGHPAEFWSDRPFGFHSVMISSAWLRAEGETALVECWSGDTLVASDEIAVSALTPIHYAPMLGNITRVRFSSKHYWQLVIDDLVLAKKG
jgi:hypothetical protein